MTAHASILAKLEGILRTEVAYGGEVRGDMDIREDLGLDSLQQMTFVVETENAFKLCFAAEDEAELVTLNDMVRYIDAHQTPSAQTQACAD